MVLAGTLAFMVMPLVGEPGVIVSAKPSAFNPSPLVVSAIVRLLMLMFAPRTVAVGAVVGDVAEMVTSAPEPGTRACTDPPAEVVQLLFALPSEAAHTLVAPERPPFQKAVVSAVALAMSAVMEFAVAPTEVTVKLVLL